MIFLNAKLWDNFFHHIDLIIIINPDIPNNANPSEAKINPVAPMIAAIFVESMYIKVPCSLFL